MNGVFIINLCYSPLFVNHSQLYKLTGCKIEFEYGYVDNSVVVNVNLIHVYGIDKFQICKFINLLIG